MKFWLRNSQLIPRFLSLFKVTVASLYSGNKFSKLGIRCMGRDAVRSSDNLTIVLPTSMTHLWMMSLIQTVLSPFMSNSTGFCHLMIQKIRFQRPIAYFIEFVFMWCFFFPLDRLVQWGLRHLWFDLPWKMKFDWLSFSANACQDFWTKPKSYLQDWRLCAEEWKMFFPLVTKHTTESTAIFKLTLDLRCLIEKLRQIFSSRQLSRRM